ncbi:hypothetical protein JTE90_002881 [Oedothorax gibbosus]|uniref:Uncharacterized protein n=1 Tax=Oedothorax gibbosus TaxID=931172 RepID=A0AAV6VD68_9ARAC|nr:hypothetical protein JTE90_002881 [Oedothorax gibbosus]
MGALQGSVPKTVSSTLWVPLLSLIPPIHKYLELSSGGMREESPNPGDDHSSPFPEATTDRQTDSATIIPLFSQENRRKWHLKWGLFTVAVFRGGKGNFKTVVGKN